MPFLKKHTGFFTFVLGIFDSCCVLAACLVASHFTLPPDGSITLRQQFLDHLVYFVVFVVVWCGAATDQRLFHSHRGDSLFEQMLSVAKAVVLSMVFSGFFIGFIQRHGLERRFAAYFGIATLAFILAFRLTLRLVLWSLRRQGFNYRQVLLVGANPRAKHLLDVLVGRGRYGYQLAGVLDDEPERMEYLKEHNVQCLGGLNELEGILLTRVIDEVYICLPVRRFYEEINSMAHLCEGIGVPVRLITDLFPVRVATSHVHQLEDIPLLSLSAIPEAQFPLLAKRLLDISVSLLFLVAVASWLFPIVALLIRLESKGPVFFRQQRVGLNQRRFTIFKFRSMVADAEQQRQRLREINEADGPVFKIRRDPRMTNVGRWLRKFSIDEMPQFINVFLGHMSLVGPRPPLPEEVKEYSWDQRRRLSVRPGITGLQQVSGRSDVSFAEWVELDLAYIDNWSLAEDFRILFRTFQVVLLAKGAA
ncbi:MAG: sugar transferase [Candidatus Hydrogenedentes bacterium]|nr:sugar transferase [Candidatus Hydrogenedentota bacterium]